MSEPVLRKVALCCLLPLLPIVSACMGDSSTPTSANAVQPAVSANEVQQANDGINLLPTPQGQCGPGSRPETGMQGQITQEDYDSGRAAAGFTCNTEMVGSFATGARFGQVGGFKVERYVDSKGQECAYYDTSLVYPLNLPERQAGVNVMDMSDPTKPRRVRSLVTPAMLSPHESLVVNQRRGVLAAVMGNPITAPGIVDLYDIKDDCLNPVLKSSTPLGILGHESGMSVDGNTFYVASPGTTSVIALDISNLSLPKVVWFGAYSSHGMTLSDDGNRTYMATLGGPGGLVIVDTSEIQARKTAPRDRKVAALTWDTLSIPQNTIPVTIAGKPYIIEFDEFRSGGSGLDVVKTDPLAPALKVLDLVASPNGPLVGAGRIIDISNETQPKIVSNLRLAVHEARNRDRVASDPGAMNFAGGYGAHYCDVPTRVDPPIVACSMMLSGLRVFDIRDPANPKEVAYFVAPVVPRVFNTLAPPSNWAMSKPTFVPERKEIWYSDIYQGLFAVKVTNGVW